MQITTITNGNTLDWLARVTRRAADEGLRLRISQDHDNNGKTYVKFALGGGMWSAPLYCEEAKPDFGNVVQPSRLVIGVDGKPEVRND
jgi:hypothetical protein